MKPHLPPPGTFPIADPAASKTLGAALRRIGYTEDALFELLGEEAYSGGREHVPVHERRLPATRLGTAIRLFFLQLPVAPEDAERALGRRGLDALAVTGLADVGEEVVPRARLVPVDELLLASDGWSRAAEDPPDYVATYTPTARTCDSLTPRPRVRRALDVGTGSGIHALLAAGHSDRVVATDVNPRALAYTELNAALNDVGNVECRLGSLFEPAEGELFDLITCNAPFVVSPESRWAYRDSGFDDDEVSAHVVRGAAARLADGGFATLLVSWIGRDEDDPDARAIGWAEETGCDAWILSIFGADPVEHGGAWNAHLADEPHEYGAVVEEWRRYLDERGVRRVTEGAVLLHRRGGRTSVRTDDVDDDALDAADAQIRRAFASRARLAELRRASDLLDARLAPTRELRIERELTPATGRVEVRIRLDEGTKPTLDVPEDVANAIAALDGRTLGAAVRAAGARERPTLRLARELLELGALRFSG